MPDWDATFARWSSPLSDTEETRASNAERMVREALVSSSELSGTNPEVFLQGSYRNNTNVRGESDIDVVIMSREVFITDYQFAKNANDLLMGVTASSWTYPRFKAAVGQALQEKFGSSGVVRGDKAFRVTENSYRLDADVVPTFRYRRFEGTGLLPSESEGVWFQADAGQIVVNFPKQHYDAGVTKNNLTGRRYKRVVRVLKTTNKEMPGGGGLASFLVECLVFNAPDYCFNTFSLREDVRAVIGSLYEMVRDTTKATEMTEVSGLKYLFRGTSAWSPQQCESFLYRAWNYLEFS